MEKFPSQFRSEEHFAGCEQRDTCRRRKCRVGRRQKRRDADLPSLCTRPTFSTRSEMVRDRSWKLFRSVRLTHISTEDGMTSDRTKRRQNRCMYRAVERRPGTFGCCKFARRNDSRHMPHPGRCIPDGVFFSLSPHKMSNIRPIQPNRPIARLRMCRPDSFPGKIFLPSGRRNIHVAGKVSRFGSTD